MSGIAEIKMGKRPINPIAECFDSAALYFFRDAPQHARLVHGIGIANMPGQEGKRIGHAWIEFDGDAFDTTWGVRVEIGCYRHELRLEYVVEYTREQAFEHVLRTDRSGPWDEKILAVTEGK